MSLRKSIYKNYGYQGLGYTSPINESNGENSMIVRIASSNERIKIYVIHKTSTTPYSTHILHSSFVPTRNLHKKHLKFLNWDQQPHSSYKVMHSHERKYCSQLPKKKKM